MRAFDEIPLLRTITGDAQMTQSKVVSQRIVLVEEAESLGHVQCHFPTRSRALRQADVSGYPRDVGIDGHYQVSWRNTLPYSAVDPVVGTDHPPQEQVHALAGASPGRTREEIPHTDPLPIAARIILFVTVGQCGPREAIQCLGRVVTPVGTRPDHRRLDRTMVCKESTQDPEQYRQVPVVVPPVVESAECSPVALRIEFGDESRRMRPHARHNRFDSAENTSNIAVSERRRYKSDDLSVGGVIVAVDKPHGIHFNAAVPGKPIEKPVEMPFQRTGSDEGWGGHKQILYREKP